MASVPRSASWSPTPVPVLTTLMRAPISFSTPASRRQSNTPSFAGSDDTTASSTDSSISSLPLLKLEPVVGTDGVIRRQRPSPRLSSSGRIEPKLCGTVLPVLHEVKRGANAMGSNQKSRTLSRMDLSATPFGMPRWEPAVPTAKARQQIASFEEVLKQYKPAPPSPLSKYRRSAERPWTVRGA